MRSILLFILTFAAAWAGSAAPHVIAQAQQRAPSHSEYNLIVNGSFETLSWFARVLPEQWRGQPQAWSRRTFIEVQQPTDAFSPSHGKRVLAVRGPVDQGYIFQERELLAGVRYRLTAQVMAPGISGPGVRLRSHFGDSVQSPWSGPTDRWHRIELVFSVSQTTSGRVDVIFDLNPGDRAWIDRVTLKPVAGRIEQLSPPDLQRSHAEGAAWSPDPSQKQAGGPTMWAMSHPQPGSVIRYTIDGSEPDRYATAYPGQPIRLVSVSTLRARAFHDGMRPSETVSVQVQPSDCMQGVPFVAVRWNESARQWWQRASRIRERLSQATLPSDPTEPAAPACASADASGLGTDRTTANDQVVSRGAGAAAGSDASVGQTVGQTGHRIINVADVRDRHPDTVTAGLAEAIALLDDQPGTLWLPRDRGPYTLTGPVHRARNYYDVSGQVLLLGRGHVHLKSDGARVRFLGRLLGVSSMQYARQRAFTQPTEQIIIEGLVLDGQGRSSSAFQFRHASRVLIRDCVFTNLADTAQGHPGAIELTSMGDNLWVKHCRFESGSFGLYVDGLWSAGVIDCTFGTGVKRGGVLMLTNNDMAPFSAGQRSTQFMAVHGCTFNLPRTANAIQATAANLVVSDNRQRGQLRTFVDLTARGPSNLLPYLQYDGGGLHVWGNRLAQVRTVVIFHGPVQAVSRPAELLQSVVRDNRIRQAAMLLDVADIRHGVGGVQPEIRLLNNEVLSWQQ